MKNRELKEWLERHVDGISITDEGIVRREDGWRITTIEKLMGMDMEELNDYATQVKETIELQSMMYELLIQTMVYKTKKEVMEE